MDFQLAAIGVVTSYLALWWNDIGAAIPGRVGKLHGKIRVTNLGLVLLAIGTTASAASTVAAQTVAPVNAPVRTAAARMTASSPGSAAMVALPVAAVSTGGFMVPKQVVLRKTTPAEDQANAIWSLRAALNVAALQCQYSRWLQTVRNYNDALKHHSAELVSAQRTMVAHFKRHDGARATNSFDQYTTRTYNSYSTLDAQYSFCAAAGVVGREVLALPKGKLGVSAIALVPRVREALGNTPIATALQLRLPDPIVISDLSAPEA